MLDAGDLDDVARHHELARLAQPLADDREFDFRARLAAHHAHRIVERHAFDRRVIETNDQITGLETGVEGGCIVDGCHHLDEAVLHGHFDTETAKLAFRPDTDFLERFRVEIGRVRVETREHPLNRVPQKLPILDFFDIVGLHLAENLGKYPQLLEGERLEILLPFGEHRPLDADTDANSDAQRENHNVANLPKHAHETPVSCRRASARQAVLRVAVVVQSRRHHTSGSRVSPWWRISKYRPASARPPVDPTPAITSPVSTQSPSSLCRTALWPYKLMYPLP